MDQNLFDDIAVLSRAVASNAASQVLAAEKGKQQAVAEADQEYPGFRGFYDSTAYRGVLANKPTLAAAIDSAERTPALQSDLHQLYALAYDTHRAAQITQGPMDALGREAAAASALTPEGRKRFIAQFESRYGDISIDLADQSQERFGQ